MHCPCDEDVRSGTPSKPLPLASPRPPHHVGLMLTPDDLDAYCRRIGYDGPVEPSRTALAALQFKHLLAIPFENLDTLSGRTPRLDVPALVTKLVRSPRGGYCFEHNALFKAVLEAFGFRPVGLFARVLLDRSDDAETARTHMLLRVPCEGDDLIADVGFGGPVPTGPLRLVSGAEQETPHESYRLDEAGGSWILRSLVAGRWRVLYRFTTEPALAIDYEVGNHYVATHPASPFTSRLVAARILPRGRLTLLNRRLTEHRLDGPSTTSDLADDKALRRVLVHGFGIEPDDATWRDAMRRLANLHPAEGKTVLAAPSPSR